MQEKQCMSHITRKSVFGVSDQVRLKPACSATEASQCLEILDIETRGIILSRKRTTKALIRLRGCAGWSAPLLFAYGKTSFLMTGSYISCEVQSDNSVPRDDCSALLGKPCDAKELSLRIELSTCTSQPLYSCIPDKVFHQCLQILSYIPLSDL